MMRRYRFVVPFEDSIKNAGGPRATWAIEQLRRELARRNLLTEVSDDRCPTIRLLVNARQGEGSFRIDSSDRGLQIIGGDPAGLGLGCLHLLDQLRFGRSIEHIAPIGIQPRFPIRALKINLPWSSYRQHPSLAIHDRVQRDSAYWLALLDHMAECRFNLLSLWALHPFHYMVDVPGFPEARSFSPEELSNWQKFWREVFAAAHERGIRTYVFFWNIFVSPAFMEAHGVAPYCRDWSYIGQGDRSKIVEDYNRAAIRALIDTYDDLDGLGVAMSERMGGMTPQERAEWIERVVIRGINEARRPVGLCLRVPHSAGLDNGGSTDRASETLGRELLERVRIRGPLWTEIKFNWSHGHSTPHLRKIHGGSPSDVLWNPAPERYQIAWMVRNEDFFVLRWAEPDFIRQHIRINGLPGVCGYFTGSECYIPAADYITRPGRDVSYRWAFQRQWLFYHVWGRLLHNPDLPDEFFQELIDHRYGQSIGRRLLPALELAGRVPRRIACFLNFTWDHTLYAEGFLNRQGLVRLDALIRATPIEPDWMGIARFVEIGEQVPAGAVTPLMLAEQSEREALQILSLISDLQGTGAELVEELADLRAWASLGRFFGQMLLAGVELARVLRGLGENHREQAVRYAQRALDHWKELADNTQARYNPIPLQILGERLFSWNDLTKEVSDNVRIAQKAAVEVVK